MNAATFVNHAADMASQMLARESRGPGDLENAMRRLEARHSVPFSAWWSLRYRKPKTISADLYALIGSVYDSECERQKRLLAHEREVTLARGPFASAFVRAADALAREEDVKSERQ